MAISVDAKIFARLPVAEMIRASSQQNEANLKKHLHEVEMRTQSLTFLASANKVTDAAIQVCTN